MFDRTVTKTLVGTVVEFAWTNPHSSIQLDVPNEKGGVESLGRRARQPELHGEDRLESSILKPGDKVTVVVNPLKSGEFGRDLRVDHAGRRPQARRARDRLITTAVRTPQ